MHERCLEGEIRTNLPYFLASPNRLIRCLECEALLNVELHSEFRMGRLRDFVPCCVLLLALVATFIYFLANLIDEIVDSNIDPGDKVKSVYLMLFVLVIGVIGLFFTV